MSFKTIAGGLNGAFWWYGPLSEDQIKKKQIYQNYLVALIVTVNAGELGPPCLGKLSPDNTWLNEIGFFLLLQ